MTRNATPRTTTRPRRGDVALLGALATGMSVDRAAEAAGVARSTAFRRLQDPDFREQLSRVRADAAGRAAGVLSAAATSASVELARLAIHATSESVRRRACVDVLEVGARLREFGDFEERLRRLEEQLVTETGVRRVG